MIKAFIFDLDNCIFDTFSLGALRLAPLWQAVDQLEQSGLLPGNIKAAVKDDLCRMSVLAVAGKYNLSEDSFKLLLVSMNNIRISGDIETYGDHEVIHRILGSKFLVTGGAGHEEYQMSKIRALGIEKYFDEITMPEAGSKKPVFEQLAVRLGYAPKEFMVIGDNPESELAAGRELGMITVQTLRPRVAKVQGFDHYIESFKELPRIISHYEKS